MTQSQPAADHADPASVASGPKEVALRFAFGLYKATLSPVLHAISPSGCLYLQTCSEYAYTAISRLGFIRGSWLALRRIARCHPWGKGGLDPVPERVSAAAQSAGQKSADHLP